MSEKKKLWQLANCWRLRHVKATSDEERLRVAREAMAALERICELDPEMAFVWKIDLVRAARAAGDRECAVAVGRELLATAEQHRRTWYYGNAIFHANNVLGHFALDAGDRDAARNHLLAAAATPGSPQLNSFGPDYDLAQRFLDLDERDAVVAFLEGCARFSMHKEMLADWRSRVLNGETFQLNRRVASQFAMAKGGIREP